VIHNGDRFRAQKAGSDGVEVMNLAALIILVLKISIILNVLAVGLKATPDDVTYAFRHPRELGRALLSMNVVMPLTALALGLSFDLKPAVKIALVALSVSPIPPVFPKNALKAGGMQDYAIGLLVAVGILAIAVIPVTMLIVGKLLGIPLHMPVGSVAALVLSATLAPLLVGIGVRWFAPAVAERAAKPLGILATVLLVGSGLPVLVGSFRNVLSLFGDGTLLSASAFALVGFVAGHLLGNPKPENSRVLAIATGSRHPGMAAAIAHANFPEQKLVLPAIVLYVVVCGVLYAVLPAVIVRWRARR
jgi:BASS family bile acid:Na+ symporter